MGHWENPTAKDRLRNIRDGELWSSNVLSVGGSNKVIYMMRKLWAEESGQDVAEYAVMLAVILVIVIGTVRLIGGNANNVFSQVSNQLAQ
jgi:Flp pilus assembly pilin Flp